MQFAMKRGTDCRRQRQVISASGFIVGLSRQAFCRGDGSADGAGIVLLEPRPLGRIAAPCPGTSSICQADFQLTT